MFAPVMLWLFIVMFEPTDTPFPLRIIGVFVEPIVNVPVLEVPVKIFTRPVFDTPV